MTESNGLTHHELPRFTWQKGEFRLARKNRMRLAWSVWMISALFVLFQFFLQLSSGEIILGLMHSFALSAFGGGLLAGSYYYIYVLLQIPAGMLLDRFGPRLILSLGACVVCIGCLLFSAAKTFLIALIGRILMGTGAAFAFVGCMDVIAIWFPLRRFALMAAIVDTAGMLGAIMGNFWLAHFVEKTGWRGFMNIAGIFAGILSLLLWLIVRNSPNRLRTKTKKTHPIFTGLKKIMANHWVWLNGIYSGVMFSIVTVFAALWAIPFFETCHKMSLIKATLVTSSLYFGIAVGAPILGWLDSQFQARRAIMMINALFCALLLSLVIFKLSLSAITIALLLFLTGLFASSYILTFAIANELAEPENSATCIGFTNMLCVILSPILQPLIGFLIALSHHDKLHFQWALSVIPMMSIFAAIAAYFLYRPTHRRVRISS